MLGRWFIFWTTATRSALGVTPSLPRLPPIVSEHDVKGSSHRITCPDPESSLILAAAARDVVPREAEFELPHRQNRQPPRPEARSQRVLDNQDQTQISSMRPLPQTQGEVARARRRTKTDTSGTITGVTASKATFLSPQTPVESLATVSIDQAIAAESIAPVSVLELLVDDFFTYIHPLAPFPHEPTFRQSLANREDRISSKFLGLLTRDSEWELGESKTLDDAITSYFLGLALGYARRESTSRYFLAQAQTLMDELKFNQPMSFSGLPTFGSESSLPNALSFNPFEYQITKRISGCLYLNMQYVSTDQMTDKQNGTVDLWTGFRLIIEVSTTVHNDVTPVMAPDVDTLSFAD
ncbi:hypothetical protein FDECE_7531 [Fusarium decemcellulare]|nr:hypothetical protein FDECE_7531 [Fusarium decemcellulare]